VKSIALALTARDTIDSGIAKQYPSRIETMSDEHAATDPAHFRRVLGHLPTGVVVVSGVSAEGVPVGITIGSFVSVSLNPPLVGFFPGTSSRSWPMIAQSGKFCASVLGIDQEELCWRFAKEPASGTDSKFDGIEYTLSPGGMPILGGSVAWIDCSIESVAPAGDHVFVLGRVAALEAASDPSDAMTFFKGKVGGVTR
jgi:flavin reductase (DIM6/NTAB) family NADH-FMN oxidoreductase RutF